MKLSERQREDVVHTMSTCNDNSPFQLCTQLYRHDSKFAQSFLFHMRRGLQADRVRMSQVECEAVVHTYAECFLFLVTAINLSAVERSNWFNEASLIVSLQNVQPNFTVKPMYDTCIQAS